MLTILHTESSPGWGGQEMRILKESVAFKKQGHKVVLAVNPKSLLVEEALEVGLDVYTVPFSYKKVLFCIYKLISLLKKEKIQVINTHSSIDAWMLGILGKIYRIPVVRTRHLSTAIKKGLNSRILYNILANRVVTTCQEVVPKIISQANLSPFRCKSIPTGIEEKSVSISEEATNKFKEQWKIPRDHLIIGSCCIMRMWKGIIDLLKAALLLRDLKKITFLLIGGGVSLSCFKDTALSLAVKDRCVFTDHLKDPLLALACLDVFCLLSTDNEGVSQASLQAAFLKKPLVTTSTGGLKEVCLQGKTGLIVDKNSPQQVSEAIRYLYKHPQDRHHFGENAHSLVREKFTFAQTVQQMEKIFKELV